MRFKLGGLLCFQCQGKDTSAPKISRGAIASILHTENNDWNRSLRLHFSTSIKQELKYILNNFLVYHLERPLRTAKYL